MCLDVFRVHSIVFRPAGSEHGGSLREDVRRLRDGVREVR
jgi:hypothetical protein